MPKRSKNYIKKRDKIKERFTYLYQQKGHKGRICRQLADEFYLSTRQVRRIIDEK